MNASTVQRPRHAARRAVGALGALLCCSARRPRGPADLPPDQSITFAAAPTGVVVGGTGISVGATATSGLPVTYSSTTPGSAWLTRPAAPSRSSPPAPARSPPTRPATRTWAPAPQVTQSFERRPRGAAPGALPALTVTADAKSRPFAVANPVLTATISGFVNGQTLATSGVTGQPGCTTTATLASPAGTYPITCSIGTLASAAYSFAFAPGTLTIVRGASSVTLSTTHDGLRDEHAGDLHRLVEPGVDGRAPVREPGLHDRRRRPAGRPARRRRSRLGHGHLDDAGREERRGRVCGRRKLRGARHGVGGPVGRRQHGPGNRRGRVWGPPSTRSSIAGATRSPRAGSAGERLRARHRGQERAGHVVRTLRGGSRRRVPYAWAWNGQTLERSAALPAGRYTIVQTLTDPYGSPPRTDRDLRP